MMLGLSWGTQKRRTCLGDVPEQKIMIEGKVKAHLVEWPSLSTTFYVDLQEFLMMKFLWPNGNVLYEGSFKNGQPQGHGKVFLDDGTLWYEGEIWGGTISGKDTLYREDGSILYQGYFHKGLYHDEGILFADNGEVLYAREFNHGKPVVE